VSEWPPKGAPSAEPQRRGRWGVTQPLRAPALGIFGFGHATGDWLCSGRVLVEAVRRWWSGGQCPAPGGWVFLTFFLLAPVLDREQRRETLPRCCSPHLYERKHNE
jgi:hypothetical protein